ncbi:hypothetical protein DY000_02040541 [Brassica cretica]|nr:hypothetical protein DY000_02040541 [Brassica cretica]
MGRPVATGRCAPGHCVMNNDFRYGRDRAMVPSYPLEIGQCASCGRVFVSKLCNGHLLDCCTICWVELAIAVTLGC